MPEWLPDWLNAELWERIEDALIGWAIGKLPSIVVILILTLVALKFVSVAIERFRTYRLQRIQKAQVLSYFEAEKRVNTLASILKTSGRIAVWVIAAMVILLTIGIEVGPLLAGAGIIGLAVGFGAQELVRDVISGFFILLENHLRTGDVAIINNTGGLVESIGLRTITLRDLSGVVHVIQNGKIDTLSNMTKDWSAMVFDIGVAYKEDIDRVIEVIREVATDLEADEDFGPKILEPLEIFGVDKFDDSAVVVRARYKTQPIEQWNVGREYRKRLKAAFDRHDIEIPFPHRTIYWGEEINPLQIQPDQIKEITQRATEEDIENHREK